MQNMRKYQLNWQSRESANEFFTNCSSVFSSLTTHACHDKELFLNVFQTHRTCTISKNICRSISFYSRSTISRVKFNHEKRNSDKRWPCKTITLTIRDFRRNIARMIHQEGPLEKPRWYFTERSWGASTLLSARGIEGYRLRSFF